MSVETGELADFSSGDIKIIKRKLTGYVGFANLPKQWHRKSVRSGFNLNLMAIGESGLGKSTLINTLFNKEILTGDDSSDEQIKCTSSIIEEDGVKLNLQVITAPNFGESLNNIDDYKPIIDEINHRFDLYLESESRINRSSSNIIDERIHALLYFIEPTGHSLKSLDLELMLKVHKKVNLIPIIAKSDTLTENEIINFKKNILNDLKINQIDTFKPSTYDNDDDETIQNTNNLLNNFPFAIIGSNSEIVTDDGRKVRGRKYPWGIIEVDNEFHNDFIKLRQLLIRNFMEDLKDFTNNSLYENYRSEKLILMGINQDNSVFKNFDPETKQLEEKSLHEAKLLKMEQEMKQVFQQKVSEKEKKLQRSEADLFARHKEMKDKLSKQIKLLEDKKIQLEKQKNLPDNPPVVNNQKSRKGFLR